MVLSVVLLLSWLLYCQFHDQLPVWNNLSSSDSLSPAADQQLIAIDFDPFKYGKSSDDFYDASVNATINGIKSLGIGTLSPISTTTAMGMTNSTVQQQN